MKESWKSICRLLYGCEKDLERIFKNHKMRLQRISVKNGVGEDVVHLVKCKKRRSRRRPQRGTLALRYRGRGKPKMDGEYSTSPRTAASDAAKVHDGGDANTIYGPCLLKGIQKG